MNAHPVLSFVSSARARLAASSLLSLALGACSSSSSTSAEPTGDAGTDAVSTSDAGDDAGANSGADAGETGAACAEDAGAVVAQSLVDHISLASTAVSSGALFWSESCAPCNGTDGTLWTEPLAGGAATQITFPIVVGADVSTPKNLVVDGALLWFVNADGLQSVGVDGSSPHVVATAASLPVSTNEGVLGLAVDATDVYLVGVSSTFGVDDTIVVRVAKTGGAATTVATVAHAAFPSKGHGLVVGATDVYWSDYVDTAPYAAGVFSANQVAGTATLTFQTLASDGDDFPAVFAQGAADALYLGMTGSIVSVRTSSPSSAPVPVATGATSVFSAGGDDLFFAADDGTIRRACGGGPGVPVASLPSPATPLALLWSGSQLVIEGIDQAGASPTYGLWTITP